MILTSHRLDCFSLTMDSLFHAGGMEGFDHVVLLLNGVTGRHRTYVDRLLREHPDVPWDVIAGPRGKKRRVASLQNECVQRYPDALYFKMDEDLVVSKGWHEKLLQAYLDHQDDPDLALITPVITNHATGAYYLCRRFPALADEFLRRFAEPLTAKHDGPFWVDPRIGAWMIRTFLDLEAGNRRLAADNPGPYHRFDERFSINLLVYDYRHWRELGGIPDDEEPAWCGWVAAHHKHNILTTNTLAHHYAFFVQQSWMDRTSLLEDLRRVNVPNKPPPGGIGYHLPRLRRVVQQVPDILRRRLWRG